VTDQAHTPLAVTDNRGHHLGDTLAQAAIDAARAEGLRVVAVCPFVKAYLRKRARRDTSAT
jgi:predicted GNAT family acetyltransferase